jgi:hypothetical protein
MGRFGSSITRVTVCALTLRQRARCSYLGTLSRGWGLTSAAFSMSRLWIWQNLQDLQLHGKRARISNIRIGHMCARPYAGGQICWSRDNFRQKGLVQQNRAFCVLGSKICSRNRK